MGPSAKPTAAVLNGVALWIACAAASGCGLHVYQNQPLDHPVRVTGFAPPDRVTLSDGRAVQLAGVRLLTPVDGDGPTSLGAWRKFERPAVLEVEAPPPEMPVNSPRRLTYKATNFYFCGNTTGFHPAYRADDLGAALVGGGAALPTAEVFAADPEYASRLADAAAHRADRPVPPGDAAVALAVGRIMLDGAWGYHPPPGMGSSHPGMLGTVRAGGARLLSAAGDPELVSRLVSAVSRANVYAYEAEALFEILTAVDPAAARDEALRLVRAPQWPSWDHRLRLARQFMAKGDWAIADELVARLSPTPPKANEVDFSIWLDLGKELEHLYEFTPSGPAPAPVDHYARLATWYRAVRPRLRYVGRADSGQFLLAPPGGGEPTAAAYFESMAPYLGRTPARIQAYGYPTTPPRTASVP